MEVLAILKSGEFSNRAIIRLLFVVTYVIIVNCYVYSYRLWDLSSGSLITALAQHSSCIQSLIWLDEHTVLSGCEKGQLACSDVRSRRTAWTFDLFNDNNQKSSNICTLTKCSSDYVVAGCTEGYASIISSRDRSVVTTERLHSDDIRGVSAIAANSAPPRGAKSANIAYVTTSSFDGSVGVWKIDCHAPSSFVPLSILRGHTDKVLSTVFNQSNGDIITSGADGSVLLWRKVKKLAIKKLVYYLKNNKEGLVVAKRHFFPPRMGKVSFPASPNVLNRLLSCSV